jgi:cytochrome c556
MRSHGWILLVGLLAATAACNKPEATLASASAPSAPRDTLKDIMDKVVDPSGDFIFESIQQISDKRGITEVAPETDADWAEVRRHLTILHDSPKLLTAEGLQAARPEDRSKNPAVENEPEEIQKLMDADRAGFARHAMKLQDAASVALKAAEAKDKDALFVAISGIDKACESCHLRYWYPKDARAHQAAKEEGVIE